MAAIKTSNRRQHWRGQGQKLSYPQELENKLVAWILEKHEAEFAPVSTQIVICKPSTLGCPVK